MAGENHAPFFVLGGFFFSLVHVFFGRSGVSGAGADAVLSVGVSVSVCLGVSRVSCPCLSLVSTPVLCPKSVFIRFHLSLSLSLLLSTRISLCIYLCVSLSLRPPLSVFLFILSSSALPGFVLAADAKIRGLEPIDNARMTRRRVSAALMLGRMLLMQTTSEHATDSPLF